MSSSDAYSFPFPSAARRFVSLPSPSSGGISVQLASHPLQDWWRTPPPTAVDRKEGPVYACRIQAPPPILEENEGEGSQGAWKFGAWVNASYATQYDQAGILLFAGNPDEDEEGRKQHWIKAGVEMEHGKTFLATVVSTPYSDFATTPSPFPITASHSVYFQFTRNRTAIGDTLVIHYALSHNPQQSDAPDDADLVQLREVPAFNVDPTGQRMNDDVWWIGVMTCGPKNHQGTEATFRGIRLTYL
ncbi:hypothetical protein ACQY0O_008381 [Thecaphora frezii]